MVRDSRSCVLLHSRRCFSNLLSMDEAKLRVMKWAIDCMVAHGLNRVCFTTEYSELVGAAERPQAWPSFSHQAEELKLILEGISDWTFVLKSIETNRGAFLIAQSVTNDFRTQSYVSVGYPFWLQALFENEGG